MTVKRKTLKPINIVRPRHDHHARVAHGQDIHISLDSVTEMGYTIEDKWYVDVDSHFLSLDEDATKELNAYGPRGSSKFVISMEGVCKRWESLGNVFLGNIHLCIGKDGKSGESLITINVFLNCKNTEKSKNIIVINPANNGYRQSVPLEPSQTLHVVISDQTSASLVWRAYSFPIDSVFLNLRQVYSESIKKNNGKGEYEIGHEWYCERMVLPYGDGTCPIFNEQHYFFQFEEPSEAYLEQLADGVHHASRMCFIGKGDGSPVKDLRLNVLMRLRGSVRRRELSLSTSPVHELSPVNPLKRVESQERKFLINPDLRENIYLTSPADSFTIDIAAPSFLFQKNEDDGSHWKIRISEAYGQNDKWKYVEARILSSRWHDKIRIQRFRISFKSEFASVHKSISHEGMIAKITLDCDNGGPPRIIYVIYKQTIKSTVPSSGNLNKGSGYRSYQYNGSNYNIGTNSDSNKSGKKKNKKKKRHYSQYDALDYYHVTLEEAGNDLLHNERISYIEFGGIHVTKYNSSTAPSSRSIYHQDPDDFYSKALNPDLALMCRTQVSPSTTDSVDFKDEKKKRKSETKKENLDEQKSSLNNNSFSMEEKEESPEEKAIMSILEGSPPPFELYWPKDKQTVEVRRGVPLKVCTLLPKSSKDNKVRTQWAVNAINMMTDKGYTLWIQRVRIVDEDGIIFQEILALPLTTASAKEGVHRIGAIRLESGNLCKTINVDLVVDENTQKEKLRWHLSYYRGMKQARKVKVDEFQLQNLSTQKRTTLMNPVGEKIDIPIIDTHQIEIILSEPSHKSEFSSWQVRSNVVGGGSCKLLDSSRYPLWHGEPVYRALFEVTRLGDCLYGEIKIKWDGEDTDTLICFHSANDKPKKDVRIGQVFDDRGQTEIDDEKNAIYVKDWKNKQSLTIFPNEWTHIAIPICEYYLSNEYKHANKRTAWEARLKEVALPSDVWEVLDNNEVRIATPFFGDKHIFHPGDSPWKNNHFVLPPLDQIQPFIYEVVDALREVDPKTSYPIGTLTFECEIDKRFQLQQKLYLRLGDLDASTLDMVECLYNPPDHHSINIPAGESLKISLPYRFTSNDTRSFWRLTKVPSWMLRIAHLENVESRREIFELLPEGVINISGLIQFECGELKKRITVNVGD